ncbi:hypothetical protein [Roseovarius sp.]|uniref:hypothetical protein n=1 Tax=Roseovarius sp. TaxID=1486281 RepID=UPI002639B670|nr:hypothetical protein [Roseovarius sp.]
MPRSPTIGVCRQAYQRATARPSAPVEMFTMQEIKQAHFRWLEQCYAMELIESALKRRRGVPHIDKITQPLGPEWQTAVGHFPIHLAEYLGETVHPCVVAICSLRSSRADAEQWIQGIIADADRHLVKVERALIPNASTRTLNVALRLNQELLHSAIMFAEDVRAADDPLFERYYA